jgi:RNA polymerase sigma-70 factor (ECF subfamily)
VLQRARASIEREQKAGLVDRKHVRANDATEQALVRRLVDAWNSADIAAIVSLLTEDALLAMPPQPERYVGRDLIRTFLATVPADGRLDRIRLIPTHANCQPAVAGYVRSGDSGPFRAEGLLILALEGDAIASLTRFAGPDLCARFGLPLTIDDPEELPG